MDYFWYYLFYAIWKLWEGALVAVEYALGRGDPISSWVKHKRNMAFFRVTFTKKPE